MTREDTCLESGAVYPNVSTPQSWQPRAYFVIEDQRIQRVVLQIKQIECLCGENARTLQVFVGGPD